METCSFKGCPNPSVSTRSGLCQSHAAQRRRGEELRPLRAYYKSRQTVQVITEKTCTVCHETKPLSEFYKVRAGQGSGGVMGRCKHCYLIKSKEWYGNVSKNPERSRRRSRINTLRKYGLTPTGWDRMWERQEGRCAICKSPMSFTGPVILRPTTDHCHMGGQVRGILCGGCNRGLGFFRDDPDILRAAVGYLIG